MSPLSSSVRAKRAIAPLPLLVLLVVPTSNAGSAEDTPDPTKPTIRIVRTLMPDSGSVTDPAGLVFARRSGGFLVIETSRSTETPGTRLLGIDPRGRSFSAREVSGASARLSHLVEDPLNARLIGVGDDPGILTALDTRADGTLGEGVPYPISGRYDLSRIRGITIDPSDGTLFILDGPDARIVRASQDPDGGYSEVASIDLPRRMRGVTDLALDPSTGHLHLIDSTRRALHEMTPAGLVVATRDLTGLRIGSVKGLTFAPSRDVTDDPGIHHLYLLHARLRGSDPAGHDVLLPVEEESGRIEEISFIDPVAPAAASYTSSLVRTIRTSDWNPPSPDSSGVVYLPASGRLLVADSEVDEMTIFQGVNLYESTLTGSLLDTYSTTNYSNEPTGISLNPANGHLFISDDDGPRSVHHVDPGPDGQYDTSDDSVTSWSTRNYGSDDPEGVTYAIGLNVLFVVDGVNAEIYRVSLSGSMQSHFDTSSRGLDDPEGIAYNQDTGTLYAVGKPAGTIFEFTTSGSLVQTIDISVASPSKPAGLGYGPRSNGSGKSIYVACRGVDNDSDPRENDGRVFELTLPGTTTSNLPPVAGDDTASTAAGTPVLIDVAANDFDPDGNLDRNSASTSCGGCSLPGDGLLANNGDGRFTYTPDPGFIGTDGFVYEICDTDAACDTAGVTITVSNGAAISVRVAGSSDDAEEGATGSMYLTSSDLELTYDGGTQTVGMRFNGINVPRGADITNAYIQFTVDETNTEVTTLTIRGQNADNAATFTSSSGNISGRPVTSASVPWSPTAWTTVGEADLNQRTPNLASIIEPIVARTGWSSGNSIVIIVTGTGERTAEAYDGVPTAAPLLHIEYGTGGGNGAPVAANNSYSVNEDDFLSIAAPGVLGNDSDPDGDPITASLVGNVSHGTLNLSSNGGFTYAPAPDYAGSDAFTYRAGDGQAFSGTATVSLTVNPINDPPSAVADNYAMDANTQLVVTAPGVLGNDSDPEGTALTAVQVTGPSHGVLGLASNGSFTYTPSAGYIGTDSFSYEARDGQLASNTVTVTIEILRVNTPPVAAGNSYSTNEDTPLNVAAPGVLGNDDDPDGDPITAVLVSGTTHGVLNLNASGAFSYSPAANYAGSDSFTYRASDGRATSNLATVSLDVIAVNDPPVAAADSYSTPAETRLAVAAPGVLANDGDVDGNPLTAVLATGPSNGVLTLNANGSFTYDPNPLFTGTDSFTYRSHDGTVASAPATVTITVQEPPIQVTMIQPPAMNSGGTIQVTISGQSFKPGASVSFESGNGPAPSASGAVVAADGRSLTATVSSKGGGPPRARTWSVRVTNPDGSSAALPNSFTINP